MSSTEQREELDAAIAEHELTEEETEHLHAVLAEGIELEQALAHVLENRQAAPPPAPPAPPAEELPSEPTDRQLKELDKENRRHVEAVKRIMGPFIAGMPVCSKCDGLGLEEPAPQPCTHPYFKVCETCNGYGKVLTGSRDEQNIARDCPACKGRGYLEALGEDGTPLADGGRPAQAVTPPPPPAQAESSSNGTEQAAGELRYGTPSWMGDPNIGR